MGVDFDFFHDWAKDRFGEENIKLKNTSQGTEICTNSFFALDKLGKHDHKFHLWMNPSGGKSKHPEGGSYRCWLTDSMGSLISLVSKVDGIPYEEAEESIAGTTSLRSLEQKVHEFFGHKEEVAAMEPQDEETTTVELPDFSFLIDNMSCSNFWAVRARNYLSDRCLPTKDLYVCTDNKDYGNRIIIPWKDRNGNLVFWNARTMSKNEKVLRYKKADDSDQNEILFMTQWPVVGSKVYIMEGEFDAITLATIGLVGCACGGKYLSDEQIELLRGYTPVLAFDTDESGLEATINVGTALLERGFNNIHYIRPPKVYKDWNKLLAERGKNVLKGYIDRHQKPFTSVTPTILMSKGV